MSHIFEKVNEFAYGKPHNKFPKSFIGKAMTPEFQKEYSKHYKAADARGAFDHEWSSDSFQDYLERTDLKEPQKRLLKQRFEMHGVIGNNEDYLGDGLTKNNNINVDKNYGVIETLNFERREVTLSQLANSNAVKILRI